MSAARAIEPSALERRDEPRVRNAPRVPTSRFEIRNDRGLYVLARCVPPSRYTAGRSSGRVAWLVTIGVATALVVGLVVGPRRPPCYYGRSKHDIAKVTVQKYASEAYRQFRLANPNRECPVALRELNEWMNEKDVQDPYGTPYTMACSPRGILVGSAGEDATFGTADDLWSNE